MALHVKCWKKYSSWKTTPKFFSSLTFPFTKFSTALDCASKSNDNNVNKRNRYINFTRNTTSWMTTKVKYIVMEAVIVVAVAVVAVVVVVVVVLVVVSLC